MAPSRDEARASRRRLAEITAGTGAFVLGVGLGALLGASLKPVATLLAAVGLLTHAWAMFDRRRIDRLSSEPDVWWSSAAYWACWLLLGGLAFSAAINFLSLP